jgi:dihydroflavonol-4-reductase
MIVVTGGTGLIGGHLLLELEETGDPVRVILRKGTPPEKVFNVWKHYHPRPEELLNRFEWYYADLNNRAEAYEALEGATGIYHCAGFVSFNPGDRKQLWETNVHMTEKLVSACSGIPGVKFVHVSSVAAVNGSDNEAQCTEQSGWPAKALSWYARSKTHGEMEVWRGITEGLNAVIVNPSVILGPGAWQASSARIFDVVYRGLKYYTRGITGFVDARDTAKAMIALMKSDISGERYVLNAANLSFRDLFTKIALALHKKPPSRYASPFMTSLAWRGELLLSLVSGRVPRITKVSARAAHAMQGYSSEKIRKQLGFTFTGIDKTIQEVAGFYLDEKFQIANAK